MTLPQVRRQSFDRFADDDQCPSYGLLNLTIREVSFCFHPRGEASDLADRICYVVEPLCLSSDHKVVPLQNTVTASRSTSGRTNRLRLRRSTTSVGQPNSSSAIC